MDYLQSRRLKAMGIEAALNIAHRGARAYAPENTLTAFAKAKSFGCQMVELDVQFSKDGELMVHHDDSLTRCTDVELKFPGLNRYNLADFTYPQLSRLDAGSWYAKQLALPRQYRAECLQSLTAEEELLYISPEEFADYQSGTVKIPTLKQVLQLAQALPILVNIELKTDPATGETLADAVVALVQAMNMQQQVLVSAFELKLLQRVRLLDAHIAIGILSEEPIPRPSELLYALDADAYHPSCCREPDNNGRPVLYFQAFRAVRRNGYGIHGWTCNRKAEIYRLLKAGVTGIISDFPNRVQDVLSADVIHHASGKNINP